MVLSLDGRKEVNDRLRKDYTGKGSYDTHRAQVPGVRETAR